MFLVVCCCCCCELKDVLKYVILVIIVRVYISFSDIEFICYLFFLMLSNKLSNKVVNDWIVIELFLKIFFILVWFDLIGCGFRNNVIVR